MNTVQYAEGIDEYYKVFLPHFPDDIYRYPLERQRAGFHNGILACPGLSRPPNVRVEDAAVAADGGRSIGIRIYRVSEEPAQPCMVLAHGGGYILGDIEAFDTLAADIAATAAVTVVSVDFRLAPEHVYPAGLEDIYRVFLDLVERAGHYRIDPRRIGITGDSSGGGFSAALPLYARDHGGPRFAAQVPINGVFDMHRWIGLPAPAPDDHYTGEMIYFATTYLGPNTEYDPQYASPLLADDLAGMPPAYIMTPEHDKLRIDSERYAQRLRAAGVEVELAVEPGMVHGCLRARGMSRPAHAVFERLCAGISRLLAREPAAGR